MNTEHQNEKNTQETAQNKDFLGDDQCVRRSIEIVNGQAVRNTRNIMYSSNRIELEFYIGFRGVYWFLFKTIFTMDQFIIAVQALILGICSNFIKVDYSIQILRSGISFVVHTFLNIVYDVQLRNASEKVNSKQIEKLEFKRKRKKFQARTWGELQTGDIIKVFKDQELPADVLILDISGEANEQTCYVVGGKLNDLNYPELKRAHHGTTNKTGSKTNDSKLVDALSGIMKWESSNSGYIVGTLKLNDNPSAFEITMENIILRGSTVYFTKETQTQLICLVLNVGDECVLSPLLKIKENGSTGQFLTNSLRTRYGSQFSNQITLLGIIQLVFTLVIPISLILTKTFVLRNTSFFLFEQYVNENSNQILPLFLGINVLLECYPFQMQLTFELIELVHVLFIQWDVDLVPCKVKIDNYDAIQQLGHVNNIVMSRSCIFNKQKLKILSVQFGGLLYEDQKKSNENVKFQQENIADDILSDFTNNQLQELIGQSNNQQYKFTELLKAITICHRANINSESDSKKQSENFHSVLTEKKPIIKSLKKSEEAQLLFTKKYGYRLVSRKSSIITIRQRQQQLRFQEILCQEITKNDSQILVSIIKAWDTNSYTMIFRGNLQEMKGLMISDKSIDFEAEKIKYLQKGQITITFAQRNIEAFDAEFLAKQINELKSLDNENLQKISEELLYWASNLEFLGIIGYQRQCNQRNVQVMDEVYKNGIQIWIISDEKEFNVLTDCNYLKILHDCDQSLDIKGFTEHEVEESIKNSLRIIADRKPQQISKSNLQAFKKNSPVNESKRPVKKDENVKEYSKDVVFFNGQSLRYILRDERLTKSFLLLCSMCNFMIASNTSALQKATLVKEIKIFN